MVPVRLFCLGLALCAALDASCESEQTSLIQDHASHLNQRDTQSEAQDDQSQPKLDPISKRIESLMQLDSISSQAKKAEDTSKTSRQAMADWIARDLKSF